MSEKEHKEEVKESYSNVALVLSLAGIVAWLIPIVGIPMGIIGLIYAFKANDSAKTTVALILCILSLIASGINAYIGAQQRLQANQETDLSTSLSEYYNQ